MNDTCYLPILICSRGVASIPFPMTEEDYDLMLAMLALWKHRIVYHRSPLNTPFLPQLPLLIGL